MARTGPTSPSTFNPYINHAISLSHSPWFILVLSVTNRNIAYKISMHHAMQVSLTPSSTKSGVLESNKLPPQVKFCRICNFKIPYTEVTITPKPKTQPKLQSKIYKRCPQATTVTIPFVHSRNSPYTSNQFWVL
jgi:hypothetical protein